jgi:ABC-type multidrug transport system permease subunit
MRWFHVFTKGVREQVRDYWILITIIVMAPLFIGIYYLMVVPGEQSYDVILVNRDAGTLTGSIPVNLGDTLIAALLAMKDEKMAGLHFTRGSDRESAVRSLELGDADVLVVIPGDYTACLVEERDPDSVLQKKSARIELVGDVTSLQYLVGAVWTGELVNSLALRAAGIRLPLSWTETSLGHSGNRSGFELYVPGLLILSIIMIIFSASAAIVREPETRTLERLSLSRLTALEFLGGTSLVQIIIALLSLGSALAAALALGYTLIPGTLGFLLLVSFLTALSMVTFSLIVAAMCRSVKEVAIIGTFPLFLLMFFSGAAFPISGGKLFSIGSFDVMMNQILSPTWAVQALNKVLVKGLKPGETVTELAAIGVLTVVYFFLGTWLFRLRHMRAR